MRDDVLETFRRWCERNDVDTGRDLIAEVERLRSRLAEVEAERDRLLTVSQQLQEDRDRVLGERDAARDEVERLRTRCAELEAHPRWSVHGSSASDIIAERDRLRAEVAELTGALDMTRDALKSYCDGENAARAEVEALRAERDAMRAVTEAAVREAEAFEEAVDQHGTDYYARAIDEFNGRKIERELAVDTYRARPTLKATGEPTPSGFVVWPASEPPRWNACNEPCDMWTGPCCCGATHTEGR